MLTLPPALGTLSKLVSKPHGTNSARFPTTAGVCVATTTDGWEVAATDFNRMLLASGPHLDPMPDYATLADAPNGATAGSLPPKWWADVCGQAKKLRGHPGVGLVLSNQVATASSDGSTATRTEVIQGQLAPFGDIIPKRTSDIGCVIRFNADLMAGLLKSLADLSDDGNDPVVTMEIRRPNGPKSQDKPLVIRADYPADRMTAVTGMLQPCHAKDDDNGQGTKFYASDDPAAPPDILAGVALVAEEAESLRAEVKRLKVALAGGDKMAGESGRVIDILREQVEEQTAAADRLREELANSQAAVAKANEWIERGEVNYRKLAEENTKLREDVPDADELVGLWGKLGQLERTVRDANTESERLRAELDAVRQQLEDANRTAAALRGEVERTRRLAQLPARRTLGQLAAVRKGE